MVVKVGPDRKKSCNLCGNNKEENYMNDTLCKACRSKVNKEKRQKARELAGKPPVGSGRSKFCSKCGQEKDAQHLTSGWCRACKAEQGKKRRAEKRAEMGLRPYGSGRPEYCYKCKAIKENPKEAYCRACAREYDNKWRLESGRTKKHQTGLCPCGNERAPYSKSYCSECAYKQHRNYIETHPEYKQRLYKRNRNRSFSSFEEYKKYIARYTVGNAIKAGYLVKQPCEVCGNLEVEGHHDDYDKPLDVRWLCKAHHVEHHMNEKN